MDFPKICTRAPFGSSAYLKKNSEYFPANNSISDDKSSRQRQHRHSAAAAQRSTHAVIATLNPASRLEYPQPELINLRVQHHRQRWRWSEAYYHLKRSLRVFTRIAHTQHTTHHKTKTTQHNTTHRQPAPQQPTQQQHN